MLDTNVFRRRLIIELAIGIGATTALIIVTSFVGSDAGRRAEHVRMVRSQIANANRTVQSLALLGADVDKLPAYQARLDGALPPASKSEQAVLALRKQLQAEATSHKLASAFSFGSKSSATASTPGFTSFTITLSGAMANVILFARELERTTPLVSVEAVEVTKNSVNASARIEGKLFTR